MYVMWNWKTRANNNLISMSFNNYMSNAFAYLYIVRLVEIHTHVSTKNE